MREVGNRATVDIIFTTSRSNLAVIEMLCNLALVATLLASASAHCKIILSRNGAEYRATNREPPSS
jgi:hypothetical protein